MRTRLTKWFITVVVAGWLASLAGVVLLGWRDNPAAADAIVVLGAAQYDGRPSPVLRARLDHAVALYKRGLSRRLVLTGGRGTGDTTTEAAVGHAYVVRQGVPTSAVITEDRGRSTEESLAGVRRLMTEHKLKSAVLVSDPFHMLRLRILAWQFGMDVRLSPTQTSPISSNRGEWMAHVLGESVKVPFTALLSIVRTWTQA